MLRVLVKQTMGGNPPKFQWVANFIGYSAQLRKLKLVLSFVFILMMMDEDAFLWEHFDH